MITEISVPAAIGRWLPLIKRPIRAARRFLKRGGIILTYHRISDEDRDPHNLAVTPENFSEHLAYLKRTCCPIRLLDLVDGIKNGDLPRRAVAITFDDGYLDNLQIAKPILESAQIPATVFVTTGYTGGDREFWWDRLEQLFLVPNKMPSQLRLSIGGRNFEWVTATLNDRRAAHQQIHSHLRILGEVEREQILTHLSEWAGLSFRVRTLHQPMTADDLKNLTNSQLIEVGAHSITHPMLSTLTPQEQSREMQESKKTLESIIGQPVLTCAFPYGQEPDYNKETPRIIQMLGFKAACTTTERSVETGNNPFLLPRGTVLNWGYDDFVRAIERFFIL